MFLAVEMLKWMVNQGIGRGLLWFAIDSGGLFLIILLHEFGHCFAARRVGGRAEEILLWPLGGLAYVDAPNTPSAQMKTAIGGPMVNVLIGLVLGPLLVASQTLNLGLFNRWYSSSTTGGIWAWAHVWAEHLFWINLILLLFNLLPAFPLDGGRILQCYLWPRIGFEKATLKAIFLGNICAVGLAIIGIFSQELLMVFVALFIYIQGAQTRLMLQEGVLQDERAFGQDFSAGYTSLEQSEPTPRRPGLFERWSRRRRQRRIERDRADREKMERKVDELLAKVSEGGLHSLSEREKEFLRDASKRYRR
jgi:Zn-dependent protease